MADPKLSVATTERNRLVADKAIRGLYRRLQGGRLSWVIRYTLAGKSRQKTLVSRDVDAARLEGASLLMEVRRGRDPVAESLEETLRKRAGMKAAREAERIQQHRTIGVLADRYLAKGCGNLRPASRRMREHYLLEVLRPLHESDAETITRKSIQAELDIVAEHRGGPTRNRALSALSACLNWAAEKTLVERVATAGVRALAEKSRDRVLDLAELRAVWDAAGELGAYGTIVRLLILTGQRRDEIADLEWRELDLAAAKISLPGSRTKNGKPHEIPVPRQAVELLEALPRRDKRVFPVQSWGRSKAKLDAAVQLAEPWVLHDLRRSAVTGMADIGVQPHIIEAVVNHISGARVADLTVSVPTNRSNLPPGHYMLFALNALGVPSVAPIIQVA